MTPSREIHLASRPTGWPTGDNFRLVEVDLPEPGPGEVLVRNLFMSVDPYMRGRMDDARSYIPPFEVGQVLVGGDHLEAAISRLHQHGRVAMCGAVSHYNAVEPPCAPRNLSQAIGKRLTLRGYIVGDHSHRMPDFLAEMGQWLRTGQIRFDETVVDGLENAPEAFLRLLRGGNTGKMLVRLADPR